MNSHIAEFLLAALLGVIFGVSGVSKLRQPKGFVVAVLNYQILPFSLGRLYGRLLPAVEVFCALLLLTGVAVHIGAIVVALLLLSFIWAVALNVARGRDLDCHCFGSLAHRRAGPGLLVVDFMLLGVAAALAALASAWAGIEPWSVFALASGFPPFHSVGPAGALLAIAICGLAAACVTGSLHMYQNVDLAARRAATLNRLGARATGENR